MSHIIKIVFGMHYFSHLQNSCESYNYDNSIILSYYTWLGGQFIKVVSKIILK